MNSVWRILSLEFSEKSRQWREMDIYHVLKEAKPWGETVDADRNNMTNLPLAGWQCLVEY